jgi:predicted lipid-binding transport protein (Tim44 family)
MASFLRRLLVLAILAAAVAAAVRALRSQRSGPDVGAGTSAPSWPPMSATDGARPAAEAPAAEPESPPPAPAPSASWVDPTGAGCPDGYTVKATQSGLYHVPGGQFYERSVPVRCYVDAAAAEADGYRAAKR